MNYPSYWVEIDCKLIQRTINKSYLSLDEFAFHLMRMSHRQRSLIFMLYLTAEQTEESQETDYQAEFNHVFHQLPFMLPDESIVIFSRHQETVGKALNKAIRLFNITSDMKKLRLLIRDDYK
jgi:hypothetical protein